MRKQNTRVSGTVEKIDFMTSNRGIIKIPVVRYYIDGEEYIERSNSSTLENIKVGDKIDILVNPNNPKEMRLAGINENNNAEEIIINNTTRKSNFRNILIASICIVYLIKFGYYLFEVFISKNH